MPPALAIPLALGGASMIASNVQNKAAAKNNETQQKAATNNAQGAWQNAQSQMAPMLQPGAAPFAHSQVTQAPNIMQGTTAGQGGGPVNASSLLSSPVQGSPVGAAGTVRQDPQVAAMIQAILAQRQQPSQQPTAANTPSMAGGILRRVQ